MRKLPRRSIKRVLSLPFVVIALSAFGADDTTVRPPPLYDTFVPPPIGGRYVDPVFGVAITRLSDAPNTPNNAASGSLAFVSTEYSTASPFNVDNTYLILQHQSYFGLYDGSGAYLDDLPLAVHAASEPRWSRSEPGVLYYVSGNALIKLDVPSRTSSLVRSFGEYAAIRGHGESDISRDGDHFVFSADELPGPTGPGIANRYVFVYEIGSDTKGPVLDTAGHALYQLYLAPDNSVAIGWLATGTARFTGVELFDRAMVFKRQLTHAIGHMRLTRDLNGDDVLVWVNSNDAQPLADCQNGLVKVRLSDARQTCLLQLDWRLAVHITAPDGNGWVFAGTYDPLDPAPTLPDWKLFSNEILQVKLDGTETRRLLHHRSRQTATYGYQPRATVSRDGSRLVFTSNYGLQAIQEQSVGYTDAYFVAIPALLTCPGSVPPGGTLAVQVAAGSSTDDWVGVYPQGAADDAYTTRTEVPMPRPQTVSLVAPAIPGTYELRLWADGATADLLGSCEVVVAVPVTVTIDDVTVPEGTSAKGNATFTVSLAPATAGTVLVAYATADGTATAGSDYVARTATLTFGPGETSKTVAVRVKGDTTPEANETFFLNLTSPTAGVAIGDAQGLGTIATDDPLLACPVSAVVSGGTIPVQVFGGVSPTDWLALYADGAANDQYAARSEVPLPRPQAVTLTAPEGLGNYDIRLWANGTTASLLGACDIVVAAPPTLTIDDVTVTAAKSGRVKATFTIRLSSAAAAAVTVAYATADGTATAGSDYVARAGTVKFRVGATSRTVSVNVKADKAPEPNETFFLNLDSPTAGAVIGDGQGLGTIKSQ